MSKVLKNESGNGEKREDEGADSPREEESNAVIHRHDEDQSSRVSDTSNREESTENDEGLEDRKPAAAIAIVLGEEEKNPKGIQQDTMKEKEVAAVENPDIENAKTHTEEEEEEKCEIEATIESVIEHSSDLIAANEDSPSSEPAPAQSSSAAAPMAPISSQQPGAFRVAGLDGEVSEFDSLIREEESVAPTVETTSSRKLVEAWKVGPEQDTSDDVEAQVQQRLAEVLRNAPVAQARVEEGEAPTVPQQQVEKPNKRRLIIAVVSLVAVLAAIGIALGVLLPANDSGDGSPDQVKQNPLTEQLANLSRSISGDVIDDTDSPQYAALEWVVSDTFEKYSSETDILSDGQRQEIEIRYVAAVLYYSMSIKGHWTDFFNFLSLEDVCSWRRNEGSVERGIVCDSEDQIISLILPNNNLNGTIPDEIGFLSTLAIVDLSDNSLNNTIPDAVMMLPDLREVRLSQNALSGQIPISIKDATELEQLWLSNNILTGTMHDSLGRSTTLRSLRLDYNELTGIVPEFASQSPLEELFLGFNKFGGVVGSIPATIERLSNLTSLSLTENAFTGTIPLFLKSLSNLRELRLDQNELIGSIPSEIGLLTNMEFLNLRNNKLSGTIPSEIYLLTSLKLLYLVGGGNNFLGPIPPEIVTRNGTTTLQEFVELKEFMSAISFDDGAALDNTSSPQFEALVWLYNNRNYSEYTDTQRIQRYAMATLYFSTGGAGWLQQDKWLSDEPECDWFNKGVTFCDAVSSGVSNFDLNENNLVGKVPPEIGFLGDSVVSLIFSGNTLTGSIPTELGLMTKLTSLNQFGLNLSGNQFKGPIPTELGRIGGAGVVNLSGNNITGSIISEFGQLRFVNELNLGTNNMTGPVPEELYNMKSLTTLHIHDNEFSGTISTNVGRLTNLLDLNFDINWLQGPIPSEFGLLTKLTSLKIDSNRLTSTVPMELAQMSRLSVLWLHNNSLTPPFQCPPKDVINDCRVSCGSFFNDACRTFS